MNRGSVVCAVVFLLGLGIRSAMAVPVFEVLSTFDAGLEGWTGTVPQETDWSQTGGNPDGFVLFTDVGGASGAIRAPDEFLGDWSALDGSGALSFDHRLISTGFIGNNGIFDYQVTITGAGGESAVWTSPGPDGATDWVTLTAPVEETAWTVTGSWNDLLASVSDLLVRIEMVDNDNSSNRDVAGVDNVRLAGGTIDVPEPAALALLAAGLAVIGWRRRSAAKSLPDRRKA